MDSEEKPKLEDDQNIEQETVDEPTSSVLESSEPETAPIAAAQIKKPRLSKKKTIIIIVVALVLVGGGAAAFVVTKKDKKAASSQQGNSEVVNENKEEANTASVDEVLQRMKNPTTGETWLNPIKPIADQDFFVSSDPNYPVDENVAYFEVGKHGDKTILMSHEVQITSLVYLYEKSPDGTIAAIVRPDGQAQYKDEEEYFNFKPNIKIDKSTHYDSLTQPKEFNLAGGEVAKKGEYPSLGELVTDEPIDGLSFKDLETIGSSKLQKSETIYVDTKLAAVGYVIKTPINTRIGLVYKPLEENIANYSWDSGVSATDNLSGIVRGCGSLFNSVSRSDAVRDSDFKSIGKSPDGKTVFGFVDSNHILIVKSHEELIQFNELDPNNKFKNYTKDNFISDHGIVAYKNAVGEWLIYTRDSLGPQGGCAKPVVYLYPTTAQTVKVRVGADVKISEPLYNPNSGWTAFAQPNGQLTVDGRTYGSLFWEGPGNGPYPAIVGGTIVSKEKAAETILTQLAEQGLNKTESQEFMGYWQDMIPNKPYVRLTWFNTAQLEQLAPLHITPKPNTLIRVFLDMEGLNRPISLPSQNLKAIPRSGFTVVEWGGLARNKLY